MIELFASILVQDKPDDGFASGTSRPAAIEQTLEGLAAESGADAVCELRFIAGARRAEEISVRCSETGDAAAEAAAAEQIDWRRRRALDDFSRGRPANVTLELDRTEEGEWSVRRTRLFTVPPLYPAREAARAVTANCRVRYDIEQGEPHVLDANCATEGSPRAFARAARNAVERWVYTRNYNQRCVIVTLEFGLQDPGTERFGTEDAPADPPCPYGE